METGLGKRIKKRRLDLNLTQEDLALRMGYKSKVAICKVEGGEDNITSDRIRKFADALETTPAYIMGWEDPVDEETAKNNRALIKSYEHKAIVESMTDLDFDVIHSFMYASPDIKAAVMKLLDIYI